MAGTADQGIMAALEYLFVDRPYVLTPLPHTPTVAIDRLQRLISDLKSTCVIADPEHHDRAVAWISHLPVMISASLIAACQAEPDPHVLQLAQRLASSGFRDTSRVGGGNPDLGTAMAEFNSIALRQTLIDYRQHLDHMIHLIDQKQWAEIHLLLEQTQTARSAFLK